MRPLFFKLTLWNDPRKKGLNVPPSGARAMERTGRHPARFVCSFRGLFAYEGGHSRVTDIQPLHEHMFEPKPYFLSTFRDRQVFI